MDNWCFLNNKFYNKMPTTWFAARLMEKVTAMNSQEPLLAL